MLQCSRDNFTEVSKQTRYNGEVNEYMGSRNLSLKGKILIIKTLILPQITYLLLVCYCPVHILQKVDKLFEFLWDKKKRQK